MAYDVPVLLQIVFLEYQCYRKMSTGEDSGKAEPATLSELDSITNYSAEHLEDYN